jgi:hypothetical protein
MKTKFLKSEPLQSWQKPTYYKLIGNDYDIQEISVWNKTSMEVTHTDDETLDDYLDRIMNRDFNNPLVYITREEFDREYIALASKLNSLTSA